MTYQNFFYTLAALRVANLASGSQPHATTLGCGSPKFWPTLKSMT